MKQTLILLRKGLLIFSRARAAVFITFLVPVVLIYLFGHVFGLYRKDSGPNSIPLAVVNASPEPAARQLVDALQREKSLRVIATAPAPGGGTHPLTEAEARAGLRDNEYRFALVLPADLVRQDAFGIRMTFLANPRNEIEAQTVNGLVLKTVFSNVPQLLGQALQARARTAVGTERMTQFNDTIAAATARTFGGDEQSIRRQIEAGDFFGTSAGASSTGEKPSLAGGDKPENILSRVVKIETEQVAGKATKNPMAARTVGGYAIMFLLFAVSGSASTLFDERNSGVFQRLLSSPVRPAHIIWARFWFGVILGLAQISALFLAGRLFFGLEIFAHAGALLGVAFAAAAACSAFGIMIAALAPSQAAAAGLATFIVISMSAIGGAWFPVSFMPDTIQTLSKLTLVYWAVEGFTDVLWAGRSLVEVLPKIGILAGIAAVVMAFSLWRFNRIRFFE
jgi:ABC-2 type transport system permease protein